MSFKFLSIIPLKLSNLCTEHTGMTPWLEIQDHFLIV